MTEWQCAPVLLHNFRRPAFTRNQILRLREARPSRVFFSADAPREGNEREERMCREVREAVKLIDWTSDVNTLFFERNLGPKYAYAKAISWFFDNVDEGIILEDDVVPTQSFFRFATELLERYRHDERIGAISGFNRYNLQTDRQWSYHFTNHIDVWGWASWKRAWKYYDVEMRPYYSNRKEVIARTGWTARSKAEFLGGVEGVRERIRSWDYQWGLALLAHELLIAAPKVKLTSNCGIHAESGENTNGYDYDQTWIEDVQENLFDDELRHPQRIGIDRTRITAEDKRKFGIVPRGFTWIGSRIPQSVPFCNWFGHRLERAFPRLFRI